MKKLLLTGLVLSGLFATSYNCLLVGVKKGDFTMKVPKKDQSRVDLTITNDAVSDGTNTYNFIGFYKDNKLYSGKKGSLGIGAKINGILPVYYTAKDSDNVLILGCIKSVESIKSKNNEGEVK